MTINLIIGISITLLLHSFDELSWLQQAEDDAVDWVIELQRGVAPARSIVMPFAFLDIDEAAYRNWGEPLHIPRNKLLDIIKFAESGNPALIVVDIDLSRWGQCPEQDLALANFLNEYHGRGKPPIILPQIFREPIKGESRRTLRKLFFDPPLQDKIRGDARVFRASPLFELDKNDFRLRRWRLWEIASNQEIIPSVELLAVALFKQPHLDPVFVFQDVEQKLGKLMQAETAPESQHSNNSTTVNIADLKLKGNAEDIGHRILYSIPWTLRQGEAYPSNFIKRSVLPITRNDSPAKEQFLIDQCLSPTVNNPSPPPDSSWLSGRVVVIGASFEDSRDIYATPLGQMPGAMVIVNAMNSLYEHGQIRKLGILEIFVIEIFLIVLMSLSFAWFNSFLGMLISSVIIIAIMLPLSFYLFKYGVWLDFAIPLIAVKLYRMHASFEENKAQAQENNDHVTRARNKT